MKKLLLSICTALGLGAFAQTIPNGGFENWVSNTYDIPQGFECGNTESSELRDAVSTVFKTTDAYHGSYAAHLVTTVSGTDTMFGYFAVGNPGGPYGPQGGMPYNQKPNGIRLYYKNTLAGNDTAIVIAIFKKNGAVIGNYIYRIGTSTPSYTLFNKTFSPALPQTPDTLIFGITCSNPFNNGHGVPGSSLTVDSINFTGVSQPVNFNGDLETWTTGTGNRLIGWNLNGVNNFKTSDFYSGSFAIELQTFRDNFGGQANPAEASTGFYTQQGPVGGQPDTSRMDTLVFYYKYIPADPNDSGSVSMSLKKNGMQLPSGAYRKLGISATYKKVSIPFNVNAPVDSAIVGFQSSSTYPVPDSYLGSDLKIDNVYLASQKLPVSRFTVPSAGCVGQPIQLFDASYNMTTGWSWVMGGGSPSSSTVQNPIVTYNSTGVKSISMVASNSFGNGALYTKTITIYPNPSISVTSATICPGSLAQLTATNGGTLTTNYQWSNGATTNTIIASPTVSTVYTVTGTDVHGCANTKTTQIIVSDAPAPSICMVSVDSTSNNNVVYWDKTAYTNVDSFIVYRETVTNLYQRIGAVHKSAMSELMDTARSVGGPNGGDPNGGSYRYKLQIRDTCGNYSQKSLYHNTIYITNSGNGQFSWAQLYSIESSGNPVNNYVLSCDTANTNHWTPVQSVAGTQQNANDPGFVHHPGASWRVDATGFNCSVTERLIGNNNTQSIIRQKSHSNQRQAAPTTGLKGTNAGQLSVYPNPASNIITISLSKQSGYTAELYNVIGERVMVETSSVNNAKMDISMLNSGVYQLKITGADGAVYQKKIVKQ